jgi:hypothetical protein
MDIGTALASVGASVELAKVLIGADKAMDSATYKFQVAELTANLATAMIALSEVKEDLASKDREIERLRGEFARSGTMVELRGFRFFADEQGQPIGFAVCPRCETVDGRLIQLVRKQSQTGHIVTCPQCKQDYDLREASARN